MSDLINFFGDHSGLLGSKVLSHLAICAVAIAIAIIVGLPLGVYLGHKHRGSFLAINVSNGFRALPSLALIAIGIAFLGLSRADIEIALVVLAIPPILTNAYTAVDQVDRDAVDAARGMGMTERQVLRGVELPLSWPLIFAGIRTGSVYVIATAPLAGLAGGGGLGDIIVNQPSYHLVGVIAATIVVVALAFAVDALLAVVQRAVTPRGITLPKEIQTIVPATDRVEVAVQPHTEEGFVFKPRLGGALALLATAAVLAACGSSNNGGGGGGSGGGGGGGGGSSSQPGKGKPTVTIGTKDFTEEFVLGQLYAQALKAKGYTVNLKSNIGATEITDKAMTSGKIDGYPEYTGETVATVFGKSLKTPTAAKTTSTAKSLYAKRGQVTSDPTPFEDVDAIASLKSYAQKHSLTSVADLKKITPSFTLGARPEFKDREEGLKGMQDVYGIHNAKFVQLAQGLTYRALDKGNVDTINVFSTDPQLASGKYKVLTDPKGVFGFQNVLFVINKPKYQALGGAQFMAIINKVNSLLTQKAMTTMNAAVALDKKDPKDVAAAFLKANGLA